ncbi:MAG: hypothetical protein WC455_29595 [Dehalococcoidia bacterium]|jgi:hypothetical protein
MLPENGASMADAARTRPACGGCAPVIDADGQQREKFAATGRVS